MNDLLQLTIWLTVLLVLLAVCYLQSKGRIISPEFCFVASFIPQAIYTYWYVKRWNFRLGFNTLMMLIGSTLVFVLVSLLVRVLYKGLNAKYVRSEAAKPQREDLVIMPWKLKLFLAFQCIALATTIIFLVLSYGTDLQSAIYFFRAQSFVGYRQADFEVEMPAIIRFIRRVSIASGYIWSYLLMREYVVKDKRNRGWLYLNLIVSVVNGFISTGGRQAIFELVIAAAAQYFLLNRIYGKGKRIKFKAILYALALFSIAVSMFKVLGQWVGRTIITNFWDYLARYLSAPLMNLDIYVKKGNFGVVGIDNFADSLVFFVISDILGLYIRRLYVPSLNPYVSNYVNGFNLGNAYTAYFPYLHDFGYVGVVIFTAIEAIVSQVFFQRSIRQKNINQISISLLLYSYFLFSIAFSFFGAFFQQALFSKTIVWNVFVWVVLRWFLTKTIRVSREGKLVIGTK